MPAFFRWLSEKFPKVMTDVVEKKIAVLQGVSIPLDLTKENPNGEEFDNLYVDMNGLIHPCSHPEDREAPTTETEMYENIAKYVDRLFACIRPRRLLFLAIDGVAPRAKMNQQRSRRFRAARDASDKAKMMDEIMVEMQELGMEAPEGHVGEWDSNVITPGTPFMTKLSLYLWYYVLDRMNRVPAWKNIKVILSDASEPGEGEHKIMNFVRSERSNEGYDPNQRHVLHGLDADLIMLALATHEVHFNILREQVLFGKQNRMAGAISEAQKLLDAQTKTAAGSLVNCQDPDDEWLYKKPLVMVKIAVLRDYLEMEFRYLKSSLPFPFDFERVIDDFIFLCFFVGNDFLPHLPSLDIRDGAIDFLIELYQSMLPSLGDYLTRAGGNLNLTQVDILLGKVGEIEDIVFQRRKAAEQEQESRERARKEREKGQSRGAMGAKWTQEQTKALHAFLPVTQSIVKVGEEAPPPPPPLSLPPPPPPAPAPVPTTNEQAAAKMKSMLGKRSRKGQEGGSKKGKEVVKEEKEETDEASSNRIKKELKEEEEQDDSNGKQVAMSKDDLKAELSSRLKQKEQEKIDDAKRTLQDPVRLHESGWKKRYYEDHHKKEDIEKNGGLQRMCVTYVQGLCWVLKYYFQGCPSWSWYYPFHYAPFASDLVNIEDYPIDFELSKPFRPVEQLLAVLPKESSHALPEPAQWLMTDPESPIAALYDGDVPLDPNGKALPWLWVLLLPFVDETDIHGAYNGVKNKFSLEERRMNEFGKPLIFLNRGHKLAEALSSRVANEPSEEQDEHVRESLDQKVTVPEPPSSSFNGEEGNGITGTCSAPPPRFFAGVGGEVQVPAGARGAFMNIPVNNVHCFTMMFPEEKEHKSVLLPGASPPACIVGPHDSVGVPRFTRNNRNNIVDLAQKFYKEEHEKRHGSSNGMGFKNGRGGSGGGGRYGPGGEQRGGGSSFQSQQAFQHDNGNGHHRQPFAPAGMGGQPRGGVAHGSFLQGLAGQQARQPGLPAAQGFSFAAPRGATPPPPGYGYGTPAAPPYGHANYGQQQGNYGAKYGAIYGGPAPAAPPPLRVPPPPTATTGAPATMASMRDALAQTLKKKQNQ